MTELLVGTKKGLFALHGDDGTFEITARAFAGEPVRVRDPRFQERPLPRVRHVRVLRAEDLRHRRPSGEWQQAEGARAARGRGEVARAALVDRARRGGRAPVRGRSAGRAVREPRRRHELGAQSGRSGSSRRGPSGTRAPAGCACTRSRPGRATPRGSPSRSRRSASGSRTTAASRGVTGTRGSRAVHARGRARGPLHPLRPQHAPPPDEARAPVHAVPRRRVPLG